MNAKLFGGILLIIGTAIGGGMLALPIATAQAGFFNSALFLVGAWVVMTLGALLLLEVNLWLPRHSNLISMAKTTLGKYGAIVAWVCYLLLFYSLIAAYTAGGSDLLHNLFLGIHFDLSAKISALIFIAVLGFVVYLGMRSVDYVNRGLMSTKLIVYVLLVLMILPFVSSEKLADGHISYIGGALTVMITSFGFAATIPSLRDYFHDDVKQLRLTILIGSFIPLICYLLWDAAIMGVIPQTGENGLVAMLHSGHSNSALVNNISSLLHRDIVTVFAKIFTSICLATSFLGVSIGLSDFIADGFKIPKQRGGKVLISLLTFLPPLIIVLFYPGAFIKALNYAGICCVVLLMLFPALMAWRGRYHKEGVAKGYRVIGGKPLLAILILIALFLIGQGIFESVHL